MMFSKTTFATPVVTWATFRGVHLHAIFTGFDLLTPNSIDMLITTLLLGKSFVNNSRAVKASVISHSSSIIQVIHVTMLPEFGVFGNSQDNL